MKFPSIEDLLKRVRTLEAMSEIAESMLTDHQLMSLGKKPKLRDYRQALLKRAGKNKRVNKALKKSYAIC